MREIKSDQTMTMAIKTANNYHDWVYNSFSHFIKKGIVLEVGSGHGKYSKKIIADVTELIVSDIDPNAIENMKNELSAYDNIHCLVMNGVQKDQLNKNVDNIILINVLEHIEDDNRLIKQSCECLNPEGKLIIFIPAFEMLYSHLDKQAGHYRRYTKKSILRLLIDDFEIEYMKFFNAIGFFGWLANKYTCSKINSKTTNMQVSLYNKLIPIIKYFDHLLPFIGQSLVVVATKKEKDQKN
ncbi:MAG: class I SAM-dependent methyltransferase [bacterium]|nr:class I SAM-dependent methyltransferase [bacterium]